jgi:hypothetical protein
MTTFQQLLAAALLALSAVRCCAQAALPQPQSLLERETFWDNRDWDWYKANIPFFECPDTDIQTTYYYRWELLTKHLTYGSPASGYTFTEFIDRPFWSGAFGAISCPAGHQLYEARWLRDPRIARDFARYWFRTPGAQPRRYSTWLANAVWALQRVHSDDAFVKDLLPDLVKNYQEWEKRHFVPEVGLFWQTGHDDGMEYNINSRQTRDLVRGAPGYRPTLNSYLWADALAIARVADLSGDKALAAAYRQKAAGLKENLQKKLWDTKRHFYFPMSRQDESANGFTVKALTLTHQSGQFAGDPHGRELIGYVPWQFSLPDAGKGYEAAWQKLGDKDGFAAAFGPTTVERRDPLFVLKKTCCWWSGQSWPYATAQTLKALANLLQEYNQNKMTSKDYCDLLHTFACTHRKNGKPYLAEACHPDTGSFEGHDSYNHSEHYFHSSFCDLVITGLVGFRPRDDNMLEVKPLASADWPYFALYDVPYRGHRVSIVWDRDGTRYHLGKGLKLFADGKELAASDKLGPLSARLPAATPTAPSKTPVNFAVNNDGTYFPRIRASFTSPATSPMKLVDGNYWYHLSPPNRWTCEGSTSASDWVAIDFGVERPIDTLKLYFLDDGKGVTPPVAFEVEYWNGKNWLPLEEQERTPRKPTGRRANVVHFARLETEKLRAVFHHAGNGRTGLTEIEAWGLAARPVQPAPLPVGNLAYNPGDKPFPKATASFLDRFGGKPDLAIDGKTNFQPNPVNRWTSYESPNATDWLAVDFGTEQRFSRLELAIYDDRGGVQAPARYDVQFWDGKEWQDVMGAMKSPEKPAGGQFNEVRFAPVKASKVRVVFTHAGKAWSGITELLVWKD